ncbi:hypothetical protein GUJ93_ZPchr0013g37832 [Zizania palustris]|uniref:Uncharacterized protein n=1 Tax=Zizania palustris TaxID=103762 RepID=A0A8J5WQV1_ZIZPA|nr:hypothetical protein GUJ93_ZPchr0013g37832 [Zizania palustris]
MAGDKTALTGELVCSRLPPPHELGPELGILCGQRISWAFTSSGVGFLCRDANQLSMAGDQGSSGELDAKGSRMPGEVGDDLRSARGDRARHGRTDGRDSVTIKSAKGRPVQVIKRLEGIESGKDLLAVEFVDWRHMSAVGKAFSQDPEGPSGGDEDGLGDMAAQMASLQAKVARWRQEAADRLRSQATQVIPEVPQDDELHYPEALENASFDSESPLHLELQKVRFDPKFKTSKLYKYAGDEDPGEFSHSYALAIEANGGVSEEGWLRRTASTPSILQEVKLEVKTSTPSQGPSFEVEHDRRRGQKHPRSEVLNIAPPQKFAPKTSQPSGSKTSGWRPPGKPAGKAQAFFCCVHGEN